MRISNTLKRRLLTGAAVAATVTGGVVTLAAQPASAASGYLKTPDGGGSISVSGTSYQFDVCDLKADGYYVEGAVDWYSMDAGYSGYEGYSVKSGSGTCTGGPTHVLGCNVRFTLYVSTWKGTSRKSYATTTYSKTLC
jgi:hypothetical protein